MLKKVLFYFRIRNIGLSLMIAVIYFVLTEAGLMLGFRNTDITPVWIITGISFPFILLFGLRLLPGIILGTYITNMVICVVEKKCDFSTALWVSMIITIGNGIELTAGYYLLKKFLRNPFAFEKVKNVFEFALGALIICLAGASMGSFAFSAAKIIEWNAFPAIWITWWLGSVTGIIIATPIIIAVAKLFKTKWESDRKIETLVILVSVFILGGSIFGNWISKETYINSYLMLPPLLWAAFRFEQIETVSALIIAVIIVLWETSKGNGPFAGSNYNDSMLACQIYVSTITVEILAVRAVISERKVSEKALKIAHSELANLVEERTGALEDYQKRIDNIFNAILKYTKLDFSEKVSVSKKGDEIDAIGAGLNTLGEELVLRIDQLQESEERMRMLIENISDYAIFRLDTTGHTVSWNKGSQQIFGYNADEIIGSHIAVFFPKDEIENGAPDYYLKMAKEKGHYEDDGWRVRKDGSEFWADCVINALHNQKNELIGFVKITRDLTKRKQAEKQLKESEKQLQAIIDNAPDAIVVIDTESKVIKWNPKAEEIFGWKSDEVIGKPLPDFIMLEKNKESFKNDLKKFFDTGESWISDRTIEIETLKKNGTEFSVSFSISVPIFVNGKYIFIGFIKDITERKLAESHLRNSENFLDSIIENLPNMLFVKDAHNLKFVRFNKAGENLLGYSREELIGKSDYDFFPKEQAGFFTKNDFEVLKSGKLKNIPEEMVTTKGNEIRILETKKIPVFNESGEPEYLLGISNDITDRKKIETELKLKSEELERSNAELEQFAYVASHDLQEPLRMVTSYVQLLERRYKNKLDDDANEFIAYAIDGTNRMRTLIQSLLAYSRVNRAKTFERVNVNQTLDIVLQDLRETIEINKAKVTVNKLPEIVGDPVLIGQLFQNLIVNAIKFKGNKDPEIVISGEKKDDNYLFSVKDNGIGIEEEYSKKIFVIFQRLHSKDKYPGTGIGLAICKKIVERHGGEIWVESEFGKGSTFFFTIKKDSKNINNAD